MCPRIPPFIETKNSPKNYKSKRDNKSQVIKMPVFDKFKTGGKSPESGLYLCAGCGEIIPLSKGERFPPCADCGSATWMMVAVAGEAGKTYGIGNDGPLSGLFICTNCKNQIIPVSKDDNFPPCRSCGKETKWQLIVAA